MEKTSQPPKETSANVLEYGVRRPTPAGTIVLHVYLVLAPFALWGLFNLERAPYRPPYDKTSLLAPDGQLAVSLVMFVIAAIWVGCVVLEWKNWRRRARVSK